jgi:hypothetical protein
MPKHDNKISFLNLSHTFEYIHLDSPHTKPSNDAILKKHYICQFSSYIHSLVTSFLPLLQL